MACAEQLLQLERMKSGPLAGVAVLALSPDEPERSRELVEKIGASRGICMSHRFVSDAGLHVTELYGLKNQGSSGPLVRPAVILLDREGREVWRFVEKHSKMRPTDEELVAALSRLPRR